MPTLTEIPAPNPSAVADALRTTGAAVVELIRQHPDLSRPVPRLKWDARTLVGHLISTTENIANSVAGKGSVHDSLLHTDIARTNDRISAEALARGGGLAEAFAEHLADLVSATAAADPAGVVAWHAAMPVPPTRAAAVVIGEFLIHGHDMATAFGARWPIQAGHVDLIVQGIAPIMPHFVSQKGARFTGTYQLRLRGHGTYTFVFADGILRVGGDWDGPVDCRISADAPTYVLAAYDRIGPVRPALTGRMVVYGRKPWLGPRFATLIQAP